MTTEQPSDATRFATRPKQRKAEERNATDNTLAKLRKETVRKALAALNAIPPRAPHVPVGAAGALQVLEEGMWRQWVDDDRTLDPEMVAEAFAAKERELTNAVAIRAASVRQRGLSYG